MPRRYVCIITFSIVMGLVALYGYSSSSPSPSEPTRIVFENAGGRVVFDHKRHIVDYKAECIECHHTGSTTKCSACHGVVFDDKFRKEHQHTIQDVSDCLTCHHMGYEKTVQAHALHLPETRLTCRNCHHEDTSLEPRPANCASCHASEEVDGIPSLRDAAHERCASCHDEKGIQIQSCRSCHNANDNRERWKNGEAIDFSVFSTPCSDCHTNKELQELIPGRMDAYHGCLPCHAKNGKGPHTKEQCNQCHTN